MSSKKGFFCELPIGVIGKIRRLAKRRVVSQGFIIEHAMGSMPDVPAREKIDHKEVARRGFKGPGLTGNEMAITWAKAKRSARKLHSLGSKRGADRKVRSRA